MVLSNRVFFCIVLHAIGAARLSLSTEDIELPGLIQKSLDPFSKTNGAEPRDATATSSPLRERLKLEGLDQNAQAGGRNDHEHVNIPQGLEESKHEMERIIKERNEIVYLTDHLRPSCREELFLGIELDHLIRAFRAPTEEKLHRLGAMEPFVDSELNPKSTSRSTEPGFTALNKMSVDSREPVDTTSQTSRSSRRVTKGRKLSILKSHWKTLTSYKPYARRAGSRDNPVLFEPLLAGSGSTDSELLISTDEQHQRLTFKPLLADKIKKPKTVLEALLAERRTPIGDLMRPVNPLNGLPDNFELGGSLTDPEKIKAWNSLQGKLDEFKSSDLRILTGKEAQFRLEVLKAFCFLGDHVLRNKLLTSVESINSFKPETTIKMVEFYTELQLHILGAEFFTSRRSIIPDLEFLTSGWDVRHFHRSIKALSAENREQIVHAVMMRILSHTQEHFPSTQLSGRFTEICEEFRRPEFLGEVRSLSSALSHAGLDTDHVMEASPIVPFTGKLIKFFQKPDMAITNLEQRRIEYQLVYYLLNFLDENHHLIIERIMKKVGEPLPKKEQEKYSYVFQEQLEFMRDYLKSFRNQNRGEYFTGKLQDLRRFAAMVNGDVIRSYTFKDWIDSYVTKIFQHSDWTYWYYQARDAQFDLWMGRVSKSAVNK
ncbi:hypothetical protein H4Q26_004387 [Puccinia striiformis f. sp. tritici PST-130]|nr:hypothetical protein Pst134EB_023741 [Puccinia striiformis f. sp. tritici]KAI9606015.1 hypothetical protein H4Q26_004387 [Puccinia striiformis f. sp. tritici PST-130]